MITSLLRTAAQALVGSLVTYLAAWGLDVPEQVQAWAMVAIAAGGITAWTWLVRWLESRQGATGWPVLARRLARWAMLGAGGARPVYVPPDRTIRATSDLLGTRVLQGVPARE